MKQVTPSLKTILVVDDDPDILDIVVTILSDYQILTATKGEEALEVLSNMGCSLLITDIKMPGMSGLELAAKVSRKYPDLKIMVLTGHSDSSNQPDFVHLWMTKPFRKAQLLAAVDGLFSVKPI